MEFQYYHPRSFSGNPGWGVAGSWPDNICTRSINVTGSGACGYNNICTHHNQRPVCQCPKGFSLANPNNLYGDCLPRSIPNFISGENTSTFALVTIADTDWPSSDYDVITPSTVESCQNACLSDCTCGASIYRDNSCYKKKLPLSNGRVDTTLRVTASLKFRRGEVPDLSPDQRYSNQPRRSQRTLIVVGSVLFGSSVFINFLLVVAGCLGFFLIYKKKKRILDTVQSTAGPILRCFTYKELVY